MPCDDVVDADAEVGQEPEQDHGREEVPEPAGSQPLEEIQQHQHRARDADHTICIGHSIFLYHGHHDALYHFTYSACRDHS